MDVSQYPALMDPQCPWVPLREWGGLPNVKWCEQTLCAVVAEPANTWSNLAFFFGALLLWQLNRGETSRTLKFWVTASIWVGFTSLVYHATVTFVLQVFDFFGMYFYFVLLVLLNLIRLGRIAKEKLFVFLWPTIAGFTAFTVVVAKLNLPVQAIVGFLLLCVLATEALASRAEPSKHGWFFLTLGLIGIAAAFSVSDASRAWCDPENHVFQGHAIWHCFSATALCASLMHYRQFRAKFI
ncbi:MAG: ceramidase domain-containing protein [Myxococcaceae bacterium]|nr:ceramidase domain-containing protein [Myxococcaceae bacterium]